MEYLVLVEYDPESGHYCGTVAGLPGIVVDGRSQEEAIRLAKEAIPLYLETADAKAHPTTLHTVQVD